MTAVSGGVRLGLALLAIVVRTHHLEPARVGAALRTYLESMGFAYVKMGQFLALRFDVLPAEVCDELRRLFDRAAPLPFTEVQRSIESELGGPLDRFFLHVDPKAVAAASLAQVHAAVALDGDRVALKVQRPGSRRDFQADMKLARAIARVTDATGLLPSLSLVDMIAEFESFTHRELDFETEARVASQLGERTRQGVRVPRIRWDLTTGRLLTMEFVEGRSLSEAIELTKSGRRAELDARFPGIDMSNVIRSIAHESLNQILVDGLFHADPHPGNILIDQDGIVVYLDFGMFGLLSPDQRRNCSGYIENAAVGNPDRSFDYFFRLVIPTADLDRAAFKRDMVVLMRDWAEWSADLGDDVSERHLGAIMVKTLETMRTNGTRLDTDLLLFWRVLFVLDSVALDLAGEVDLIDIMNEFFAQHASPLQRHSEWLRSPRLPDMAPWCRALDCASRVGSSSRIERGVVVRHARRRRRDRALRTWLVVASLAFVAGAALTRI